MRGLFLTFVTKKIVMFREKHNNEVEKIMRKKSVEQKGDRINIKELFSVLKKFQSPYFLFR